MNKFETFAEFRRALSKLEKAALRERATDSNSPYEYDAYLEGFLSGYLQALRDARQEFDRIF